jgi:glycerophosphoryl diester phosphodiesterase
VSRGPVTLMPPRLEVTLDRARALRPRAVLLHALLLGELATLVGCGGDGDRQGPKPFATLDGKAPLVIGHRGLPGLRPKETRPAYELAADAGADVLELDVPLSRDCVLMARHNAWLSDQTNVA